MQITRINVVSLFLFQNEKHFLIMYESSICFVNTDRIDTLKVIRIRLMIIIDRQISLHRVLRQMLNGWWLSDR